MAEYIHSISTKLAMCDRLFPATGVYGHLAILDNLLLTDAVFTVNATTDVLTFAVANKLVTGSRIRFTSTGTMPGGMISGTDYYAIKTTTTTFKIAETLALSIAGTAINLTDAGSGTLMAYEQSLNETDSIAAVVAHEITNSSYTTRFTVENLGVSVISGASAQKNPYIQIFSNTSTTQIDSNGRALIYGGTATIGNTTGTGFSIHSDPITIYSGETKSFSIIFIA